MRISRICVSIVAWLVLGAARQGAAQTLTNHSFDFVLQGDDPGVVFTFDLPGDPLAPVLFRFDGFFQNLDLSQTGVRYDLSWTGAAGGGVIGGIGTDFMPLPASGQWPVSFEQSLGFTPATVFFHVEGGGPGDHFQFVGQFTIQAVPEPGVFALLGTGGIAGLLWRRFRRASTHAA